MRLGEEAGGLAGVSASASSPNPTPPDLRGSARHAGVPSPVPGSGQGQAVSGGGLPFFCEVCDRWHYDRLDDSGGSSFLCSCPGVDSGMHESWCPWNLLDEVLVAGQGLYDAEGGNMRAEAATGWETAVERVGRVRGES